MKKIIGNLCMLFVAAVCLNACHNKGEKSRQNEKSEEQILGEISSVHAIGKIIPAKDWAVLASPTSARIQRIMVSEGDTVHAGQLLMTLESGVSDLDVSEAQAQLRAMKAENKTALDDLRKAEVAANEWKDRYETSRKLLEQNAETREQTEQHYSSWQQQELAVRGLRQKIKAQEESERQGQIQVRKAEQQLSGFDVSAPMDGIIVDLSAQLGKVVGSTEELGKIVDVTDLMIEAEVDELFANDVKTGQSVYISTTTHTDTLARGTVSYVSPILSNKSILYETANEGEDRRVRKIKIKLQNSGPFAINAKVNCQIKIR
jgi:multidrug resistance efflux pump